MLTWKIVEASKASVLYIYIDNFQLGNTVVFRSVKKKIQNGIITIIYKEIGRAHV